MGEKNFTQPTLLAGEVGETNIRLESQTMLPAGPGDGTHGGTHIAASVLLLLGVTLLQQK